MKTKLEIPIKENVRSTVENEARKLGIPVEAYISKIIEKYIGSPVPNHRETIWENLGSFKGRLSSAEEFSRMKQAEKKGSNGGEIVS